MFESQSVQQDATPRWLPPLVLQAPGSSACRNQRTWPGLYERSQDTDMFQMKTYVNTSRASAAPLFVNAFTAGGGSCSGSASWRPLSPASSASPPALAPIDPPSSYGYLRGSAAASSACAGGVYDSFSVSLDLANSGAKAFRRSAALDAPSSYDGLCGVTNFLTETFGATFRPNVVLLTETWSFQVQ